MLIIIFNNIEVFYEGEERLCDETQEITSRIGVLEIIYVIQEFGSEVTGRGRTLDILIRGNGTVVGIFVQCV